MAGIVAGAVLGGAGYVAKAAAGAAATGVVYAGQAIVANGPAEVEEGVEDLGAAVLTSGEGAAATEAEGAVLSAGEGAAATEAEGAALSAGEGEAAKEAEGAAWSAGRGAAAKGAQSSAAKGAQSSALEEEGEAASEGEAQTLRSKLEGYKEWGEGQKTEYENTQAVLDCAEKQTMKDCEDLISAGHDTLTGKWAMGSFAQPHAIHTGTATPMLLSVALLATFATMTFFWRRGRRSTHAARQSRQQPSESVDPEEQDVLLRWVAV